MTAPADIVDIDPQYGLFPHQRDACLKTKDCLQETHPRAVLHMPTGAGKTRTAMHLIVHHLNAYEPTVVIWLAYSEELCEQAASEFETAWRHLGNRAVPVFRFWGAHQEDPATLTDGFIVAGLAKVYSRLQASTSFIANLSENSSLIIIDEAHQAVAETYSAVLDILQSKGQESALLGLTATPGRSWDDIDEDERLAQFFGNQKVSLEVDGYASPVDYLIDEGYLAKPKFKSLLYQGGIDLTSRDIRAIRDELDVPVRILKRLGVDEQRNLRILAEVERLGKSHNRILMFGSSVQNARLIATTLDAHGAVEARVVTGETPPQERRWLIDWYKDPSDDSPRVLCNYGVLTAGFDAPLTSAAVIARPTKSLVLFSQMIGRAIRGVRAGGNPTAEIVTVVDTKLPGFRDLSESFSNWEDAGWRTI